MNTCLLFKTHTSHTVSWSPTKEKEVPKYGLVMALPIFRACHVKVWVVEVLREDHYGHRFLYPANLAPRAHEAHVA